MEETNLFNFTTSNLSDHLCKVYKIGKGSENIQADGQTQLYNYQLKNHSIKELII